MAHVRVYANRVNALLLTIGSIAFTIIGVVFYFQHTRPEITTRPWMYDEPTRMLMALCCIVLFGAVTLRGLYWALTPWPMFEVDATGISYRLSPFMWGMVRWHDVASIVASKETYSRSLGGSATLTLYITLRDGAFVGSRRRSEIKLAVHQRLLSIPIEALVRHIRAHHAVTLSGFSERAPRW